MPTTRAPSTRVARACAAFGLDPLQARAASRPAWAAATARRIITLLAPGEVALITGPSGGGKSTILAELARLASHPVWVRPATPSGCLALDIVGGEDHDAVRAMTRSGLGEPRLFALPVEALSDGQRFRLGLAGAMRRASVGDAGSKGREGKEARDGGGALLLIDEFASTLDRTTAINLARLFSRWASRQRIRAVCATAHDDLLAPLAPAVLACQPLDRAAEVARSPWASPTSAGDRR